MRLGNDDWRQVDSFNKAKVRPLLYIADEILRNRSPPRLKNGESRRGDRPVAPTTILGEVNGYDPASLALMACREMRILLVLPPGGAKTGQICHPLATNQAICRVSAQATCSLTNGDG